MSASDAGNFYGDEEKADAAEFATSPRRKREPSKTMPAFSQNS